jgi:hypothetical protein
MLVSVYLNEEHVMTENTHDDRRHFSRVPFHSQAHIQSENGFQYQHCDVIDVSLHGLLIAKPSNWSGQLHDQFTVELVLDNGQVTISMSASVAHIDTNSIGFICEHIDLDSISHLKRLVELNLGDSELLQRELSSLIH